MKNATQAIALLAITLPLSSCFLSRTQINDRIDPGHIAALVPGETTARQVVESMGAPVSVVQLARRSAYRYDFRKSKTSGLWLLIVFLRGVDVKEDRVWVFFDENEVLTHVGTTFQADLASYGAPIFSAED